MPVRPAPSRSSTTALFAASAVLACTGLALIALKPSAHRPPTRPVAAAAPTTPAPRSYRSPAPVVRQSTAPGTPAPATTASAAPSLAPVPGAFATPVPLPAPIAAVAVAFTQAWNDHDARPGHDTSFNQAAQRAAVYCTPSLTAQLSTSSAGAWRQWSQWTAAKAQVVAQITRTAVPDGAPTPTARSAYAAVLYRVTVTPAGGTPTSTDQTVVLQLQTDTAGHWRVVALPGA